jgi:hypothetical protein
MKLQVTDLILVTKEYDRVQENHLLTLEGFLKELAETTQGDVKLQAELLERLFRTKKESSVVWKPENCTLKSMGFSFCRSRQELKEFLLGLDNSPDKDIVFVTGLSSPECMTWLEENGLSPNGEDSMEYAGIYPVEIRETLSRVENIPANSMEEARQIAEEMYREEKVVLDAEDYQKTEYFPAEGKSR